VSRGLSGLQRVALRKNVHLALPLIGVERLSLSLAR
jgi:hypothetical protein